MKKNDPRKEAQKRYETKLREEGRTRKKDFNLRCHVDHDKDVIEWMESQENKSGYLKELVRKDIKKESIARAIRERGRKSGDVL